MSVLVLALPPMDRPAPGPGEAAPAAAALPVQWPFAFSSNGQSVQQAGLAALSALPKADQHVLLVADADVSWHRVLLPKAPSAKMRQALMGLLEEQLLEEDADVHLAVAPGGRPGQKSWVAAVNKPWLTAALKAVESAGREVSRVVCSSAPVGQPVGHFSASEGSTSEFEVQLLMCRREGVVLSALAGDLARALLPPKSEGARYTANPAAAAVAERWLGERVTVMGDAERMLAASQSAFDLRQFDLAGTSAGLRTLREARREFFSPSWRPVRWGAAALLAANVLGLNAYAWQQQKALSDQQLAMKSLLQSTFPSVRAVVDAALQMQRETDRARAQAGRAGEGDLEALLGMAASAWPEGQGPSASLRFEGGRLNLAAQGWNEGQQNQFRERLLAAGYAVEFEPGRLTINRTETAATSPAPAGGLAAPSSGRTP